MSIRTRLQIDVTDWPDHCWRVTCFADYGVSLQYVKDGKVIESVSVAHPEMALQLAEAIRTVALRQNDEMRAGIE